MIRPKLIPLYWTVDAVKRDYLRSPGPLVHA